MQYIIIPRDNGFPLCVFIILYYGKGDGFFVVLPSYYGMQFSVDINCPWYWFFK